MEDVAPRGEKATQGASPFPWPMYDIDGGRQSPFEDEDDYDYDSCCGPPLVTPGLLAQGLAKTDAATLVGDERGPSEANGLCLEGTKDQMDMCYNSDPLLVDAVIVGEERFAGFKRRGRPTTSLSPSAQRQRVVKDVPYRFGR
eukprot:CAMPEP_0179154198 /NCGR_PEP_ID=MMETSP0796-20121207/75027_1 /TAXON_ID=73915 /ORGANISM="Pyrodinium bahamense, Strain pbaha01" /LENGTH=142 /DNA_ID=CAMNT_0020855543 /DNA_START=21 /DNA_END=449 /DNA_ORIENTATION=-